MINNKKQSKLNNNLSSKNVVKDGLRPRYIINNFLKNNDAYLKKLKEDAIEENKIRKKKYFIDYYKKEKVEELMLEQDLEKDIAEKELDKYSNEINKNIEERLKYNIDMNCELNKINSNKNEVTRYFACHKSIPKHCNDSGIVWGCNGETRPDFYNDLCNDYPYGFWCKIHPDLDPYYKYTKYELDLLTYKYPSQFPTDHLKSLDKLSKRYDDEVGWEEVLDEYEKLDNENNIDNEQVEDYNNYNYNEDKNYDDDKYDSHYELSEYSTDSDDDVDCYY